MKEAVAEPAVTVSLADLEAVIRRVVREEMAAARDEEEGVVDLDEDSPLYRDMEELLRMKREGRLKLLTHEEVWGE